MHFCRIADGRLVEHWPVVDQLGLLQPLNVAAQKSDPRRADVPQCTHWLTWHSLFR
jgi:hypothetical protein